MIREIPCQGVVTVKLLEMVELVQQYPVVRRHYDDPLYSEGNKLCQSVLGKQAVVLVDEEEYLHKWCCTITSLYNSILTFFKIQHPEVYLSCTWMSQSVSNTGRL